MKSTETAEEVAEAKAETTEKVVTQQISTLTTLITPPQTTSRPQYPCVS